jgi:hypothetical protein
MKINEEWQFIVLKSARLVMATFCNLSIQEI